MMSPHIPRGSLQEVSLLKLFFEKEETGLHRLHTGKKRATWKSF